MKSFLNVQNLNGKNVYYLNKEGRDWIGSEKEVKWSLQAEHYLMRNEVYIHYGCPKTWEVERKVAFTPAVGNEKYVRPDARFIHEEKWHFLEVDRTQSMGENKKKLENYAEVSPVMKYDLGHKPVIIFYTLKESREKHIKALCQQLNLDCVVFLPYDLR
jgi:hypothetical protein